MNWREFIAEMTGQLAWPVAVTILVLVLLTTQRRAIAGLVHRSTEWTLPGGFSMKATSGALSKAIAAATEEPSEVLKEVERRAVFTAHELAHLQLQDIDERRREIEEVARTAALTAQYAHWLTTPVQGRFTFFEPVFTWQDDGTVRTEFTALAEPPTVWLDADKSLHFGPMPGPGGAAR